MIRIIPLVVLIVTILIALESGLMARGMLRWAAPIFVAGIFSAALLGIMAAKVRVELERDSRPR